jgi:hypothetical protein
MKKGRASTMTHDYKCNGTTTLFAALNVLDGKVIDRCMQRHRHQEFIRFLSGIEAVVPVGRTVHVILDNKSKSRISLWDAEQDDLGWKPAALEHRHRGEDAPKTRLLAAQPG